MSTALQTEPVAFNAASRLYLLKIVSASILKDPSFGDLFFISSK